jgi:hypothetical protein
MKICNYLDLMNETDHLVFSKVSIQEKGNFDLSPTPDVIDTLIPDIKT